MCGGFTYVKDSGIKLKAPNLDSKSLYLMTLLAVLDIFYSQQELEASWMKNIIDTVALEYKN